MDRSCFIDIPEEGVTVDRLQEIPIVKNGAVLGGRRPVVDLGGLDMEQPVIPELERIHLEAGRPQVDRQRNFGEAGVVKIAGMGLMLIWASVRHTRQLYQAERLP